MRLFKFIAMEFIWFKVFSSIGPDVNDDKILLKISKMIGICSKFSIFIIFLYEIPQNCRKHVLKASTWSIFSFIDNYLLFISKLETWKFKQDFSYFLFFLKELSIMAFFYFRHCTRWTSSMSNRLHEYSGIANNFKRLTTSEIINWFLLKWSSIININDVSRTRANRNWIWICNSKKRNYK